MIKLHWLVFMFLTPSRVNWNQQNFSDRWAKQKSNYKHLWEIAPRLKYLSTFSCVLIFIRIDPNRIPFLRITSKRIKLIRTNIYKLFQVIKVNLHSLNRAKRPCVTFWSELCLCILQVSLLICYFLIIDLSRDRVNSFEFPLPTSYGSVTSPTGHYWLRQHTRIDWNWSKGR